MSLKRSLSCAIALIILWIYPNLATSAASDRGWMAYGDLRGHIEPCGCDPATDMGGVRRVAAIVERERRDDREIGVFNLGNNVPLPAESDLKTEFLLASDAHNRPTASLLNVLEMTRIEGVRQFAARQPEALKSLNFVLSNAADKALIAKLAAPMVVDQHFVVLGYVWDEAHSKHLTQVSPELLKNWRSQLKEARQRTKVLLYSGPSSDLQKVASSRLFDVIISANAAPFDVEPGTEERKNERSLLRQPEPEVYMVPLGGQGVLRGGRLLYRESKSLVALLQGNAEDCAGDGPKWLKGDDCSAKSPIAGMQALHRVTWLDAKVGESAALQPLFARYETAVKEAFAAQSTARKADLADSPFAGAAACVGCHAKESEVYRTSKHAQAMATLRAKGKETDGECVACHVVGAKVKGGFVSIADSPYLANVQCENCHGPRKEHIKNPMLKPTPSQDTADLKAGTVCVSCHNRQHSPAFDPVEYWRRIAH